MPDMEKNEEILALSEELLAIQEKAVEEGVDGLPRALTSDELGKTREITKRLSALITKR